MAPIVGALRGLDLSDKQKDELKQLPEKMRTNLLKEMKGILTDEQYKKVEEAVKKTPVPPLRITPGGRGRGRSQE